LSEPDAEFQADSAGLDGVIERDKRVAVLSPVAWRTPPRHWGAWKTVASNLTEGLVSRGWDVTLFATRDSITRARLHAVIVAILLEMGIDEPFVAAAFGDLAPTFDPGELESFLRHPERWPASTTGEHEQQSMRDAIRWAAHCDYVVEFPAFIGAVRARDLSRVAERAGRH
jgi:hypothetical protein